MILRTTLATFAMTGAAGLLLAGCSATSPTSDLPAAGAAVGFGHVHGIVEIGDNAVLIGTHNGLYTLTEGGTLTEIRGSDFDAMGLTAAGDTLYASGHPGPVTPAELGAHNLGIIRSIDAGVTWKPVAFSGKEDFHVLTATDTGVLFGIGSSSIVVRASLDDGATWTDGADLPAADLAVTTDGTLYAATQDGLQESRDAGATFAPAHGAPLLYLVEADPAGGLVGVDTGGTLWRLQGTSWEDFGVATGIVQALGVTADGAVVLFDDRGVVRIRDAAAVVVLPSGGRP